ncbi:MAG: Ig-like domain-containing protein [Cytophagales bacterium]|nr:Ig-like domain-containing protein [Cytophagales bacterium]
MEARIRTNPLGALLCLLLCFAAVPGRAQDLIRVSPVTSKILMLTFSEGHVDYYHVYGQAGSSTAYYGGLNTTNADNKASYSVTSPNDGNYATARQPVNLGRKAKAKDYVDLYSTVKYVLEHSVYLELPTALVRGRSYTVNVGSLVQNGNAYTFTYNEKQLWSPAVHVNQVGFLPGGVKHAYLSQWMGSFNTATHPAGGLELDALAGAGFQVVRTADNVAVFTGTIAKRKDKSTTETNNVDFGAGRNFTNADVWECNFSAFTTPGEYYVAVDNMGRSHPFKIEEAAFRNAYHAVSKALFTQRQGVDKELEGGKVYPRGHHPDDRNVYYTGTTTKVNVWGYYYDAGDWDGHNRHIGVPMDLMLCYDFRPGNFKDGDVGNRYRLSSASPWISEGTDGLPDILNEAKWLVSFYKRAKDALVAAGKGTGGVTGGRLPSQNGVTGEGYIGPDAGVEGRNSWTDDRPVYVNAEQTANTYLYAGAAAYYAVVLNKFNNGTATTESNGWRTEAVNAYNWADARADDETGAENVQAKILGAACLYRLTGEAKYQSDLKRMLPLDPSYPGWDAWQRMQTWHYAAMIVGMCPPTHPNLDVTFQTTLRNQIIAIADNGYVTPGSGRGFRFGFDNNRHTSNGAFSVPRMEMVAFAYQMTGDAKYLQQIQHAASYTLGGNENNMSYVAGLGHHPDENTFHPDAWTINDYNSKVYTNTSFPGYVNYYAHKSCDWIDGCAYNFSGDEDFSRATASPAIGAWPAGEWRMNNRYSIAGSEFTMEETLSQAAFTYGYLAGSATAAFTPNARPTLALGLTENQNFPKAGCNLTVAASADTRVVKYYYEWHYIGESRDRANNFKLFWTPPQATGTSVLITAVGYDDRGLTTLPTDAGDRTVVISSAATCSATPVAVTGVSVSPATASIGVGATQQLTATVAPADATNKTVAWSSSNAAVATVSAGGLVTGVAAGTATITVTTQDGGRTATSTITVTAATPATGLTHHWKFNNSGKDEIGTNDATLQNGAAYTTTAKEGAAALNLAPSTSANAAVGVINLGTTFTVTMWAYNTGDQLHQNWLMSNSDGSVPGFRFFVNSYNTTDGRIAFENRGTSTTDWGLSAAGAFPFNRWNLVALVVNGSAYTVYVNGTPVHTGTVQPGTNFNRAVYLGSMGDGNTWNTWKGYLDDVKTYNRALTAAEIQAAGTARLAYAGPDATGGVQVFPNPASRLIRVSFRTSQPQQVRFRLVDAAGREVETHQREVGAGFHTVSLPIHARRGFYNLSVEKDGGRTIRKVVVE